MERRVKGNFHARCEPGENSENCKTSSDCYLSVLKLTNEAKLMAIDPRLVYADAPNDPDSKLMGLAHWLKAHGGTVCYMIINAHGHLDSIAETYGFMSEDDFNYTHDGVDYIVEGRPEIDYNFIIYDFGGITKEKIKAFKECDLHFLCGASDHLHEIVEFSKALKPIKTVKPHIITRPIHKDLERAFKKEVCDSPIIINESENMLDFVANSGLYKEFIKEYIVETQKRF